MLTKTWTGSDVGKMLHVTVLVQTTGAPLFVLAQGPEPTCSTPPSTRPYIVSLAPDRWSGVSGQLATKNDAALRGFTSIVTATQPSRIGLVFGGGCSYGHGLSVSGGSATLTVTEFEAR